MPEGVGAARAGLWRARPDGFSAASRLVPEPILRWTLSKSRKNLPGA
ncbi:hypothetical protein STTU_0042 [Streptomyces sp. Tu6071]|nr:hypothetical protein STTU_0042 [Streptomyces sp. Tu6071]